MDDWSDVPVFGFPPKSVRRVPRAGVYGLIGGDCDRVALVRIGKNVYLPGGGVEAGESTDETIGRELLEECGLTVRRGDWTVRAIQFIDSASKEFHYENRSTFVDATIEGPAGLPTEIDHELIWLDAKSAIDILTHASQSWAVEQWMQRQLR